MSVRMLMPVKRNPCFMWSFVFMHYPSRLWLHTFPLLPQKQKWKHVKKTKRVVNAKTVLRETSKFSALVQGRSYFNSWRRHKKKKALNSVWKFKALFAFFSFPLVCRLMVTNEDNCGVLIRNYVIVASMWSV